jgi:hypothetical protein
MTSMWAYLSQQEQDAAAAAARVIEDAGLRFVLLLFTEDNVGAVISNIEPRDAAPRIEQALAAARASVDVEPITNGKERLQ